MYRINRVFDNSSTVLVKISGDIEQRDCDEWASFLNLLKGWGRREIILDFCGVSRVSPAALVALADHLAPNVFLMNCDRALRNTICSFGHEDRLLDREKNGTGLTLQWPAPDHLE